MTGINFNNVNFSEIKPKDYQAKNGDLAHVEDGLTKEELSAIDTDKDGVLTEEEFKKLKGSDEEKTALWNALSTSVKSTSKTANNGNTTTTQEINGQTITSTYNKDGELIGYSSTVTNEDGSKTEKNYSVNNDQHKLEATVEFNSQGQKVSSTSTKADGSSVIQKFTPGTNTVESTTTKYLNGLTQVVDAKTGDVTQIAADGTSITKTKDGKYKQIIEGGKTTNFNYDNTGAITTISITENGKTKTYDKDNITLRDDGGYDVKDDKGKWAFNIGKASDGRVQANYFDSNGNPTTTLRMDAHGYPESHVDRVGGSGSDKWNWKKATFCSTGNYREYEPGISRDYTKDGRLTSIQTYYQNDEQLYEHVSNSSVWASQIKFNEDGSVKSYVTWDYEKNGDGTVTQTATTYDNKDIANFDKSKGTVTFAKDAQANQQTVSVKDGYMNTLRSETFNTEGKSIQKVEYKYDQEPATQTFDSNSISQKIVEKDGKKYIETWMFGVLVKQEVVGEYTEDYTYHDNGALESKKHTSADGKNYTYSTYRPDGTSETESTYENYVLQPDTIVNHKEFDENGNLELNTDYTYNNIDRTYQTPKEIRTTDGQGNLVEDKKYDQYGNLSEETKVHSDGSSTETKYAINYSENVPVSITDRDQDGNVTNEQKTLFQMMQEMYPNMTSSQIKLICTFIKSANNGIDNNTLLDANALKGLNLDCFQIKDGIVSAKK